MKRIFQDNSIVSHEVVTLEDGKRGVLIVVSAPSGIDAIEVCFAESEIQSALAALVGEE